VPSHGGTQTKCPTPGLGAHTATAEANLDVVAQIPADKVCPALAHRPNLDVVDHTVTGASTAAAATCLAVTHGSTVETEMFQQFFAVIPFFMDLSSWFLSRADIAAGILIPIAYGG
jgi:uncharacterized protein YuzB (UPF0349 family)